MSSLLALQGQGILFSVPVRNMARYGHNWLIVSLCFFAGDLNPSRSSLNTLQGGNVSTRLFITSIVGLFAKKKKENKARPGCFCLAKRLRHNVLLVPRKTPFGTYSVSFWPARIPSCQIAFFFFFPLFCFLWKNIFYWDVYRSNYLLAVCPKEIAKFWTNRKSIFTVLKTLL